VKWGSDRKIASVFIATSIASFSETPTRLPAHDSSRQKSKQPAEIAQS
jgi:hypothetical protein